MLDDNARFEFAGDRAAAKVIDGDAIIIDTVSGRYYSLEGPAEVAWSLLATSASLAEVAQALRDRYDTTDADVLGDVRLLTEELLAENLLRVAAPGSASVTAPPPTDAPRAPYSRPALVVFRDLENMLAFDPPLPHPADGAAWGSAGAGE
ncbi:MAG: PqqD family protein [Actinomycetes bacterium]